MGGRFVLSIGGGWGGGLWSMGGIVDLFIQTSVDRLMRDGDV